MHVYVFEPRRYSDHRACSLSQIANVVVWTRRLWSIRIALWFYLSLESEVTVKINNVQKIVHLVYWSHTLEWKLFFPIESDENYPHIAVVVLSIDFDDPLTGHKEHPMSTTKHKVGMRWFQNWPNKADESFWNSSCARPEECTWRSVEMLRLDHTPSMPFCQVDCNLQITPSSFKQ